MTHIPPSKNKKLSNRWQAARRV